MNSHESWTDKLSDYLDGELADGERADVAAHVAACPACARTLEELRRVVAEASSLPARPPDGDLWNGIVHRIGRSQTGDLAPARRRISFTLPELAAASVLCALLSGGAVALLLRGTQAPGSPLGESQQAQPTAGPPPASLFDPAGPDLAVGPGDPTIDVVTAVGYGDTQFEAAVADLERALRSGRGRLDGETIAVVEENLAIIDRAIAEARSAIAADPANGYLSGHLMETRRRKLDLLRRAAALAEAN